MFVVGSAKKSNIPKNPKSLLLFTLRSKYASSLTGERKFNLALPAVYAGIPFVTVVPIPPTWRSGEMSDQVPEYAQRTIDELQAKIEPLEAEIQGLKIAVNSICTAFQVPVIYKTADQASTAIVSSSQRPSVAAKTAKHGTRPDRYFGKPLASVVRTILSARHECDIGPATAEEIYAEMLSGGYNFEDKSEENSKRALAVSLSKNTTTFRRLPNDMWGLAEWYGPVTTRKPKTSTVSTPVDTQADSDDEFDFAKKEEAASA